MKNTKHYYKYLFPKILKHTREIKKISIEEMSSKISVTTQIYTELENGNRFPTIYGLKKISKFLEVTPVYLLIGSNDINSLKELPLTSKSPFVLWYYFWIDKKLHEVTFTQIASYCSGSQYVLKEFGIKRLCDISWNDVDIYLRSHCSLSRRTIRDHKTIIKQVFDLAEACRQYNYNPAVNVKLPKTSSKAKTTKIIDQETRSNIMQFEDEMQLPAVIMLLAGLRRGEMLALTFGDINLEKGYISVDKVIEMKNGVPSIRYGAKSDAGVRKIDMPDILIDFIKVYLKKHPKKGNNDYIISNQSGEPLAHKDYSRKWNKYIYNLHTQYKIKRFTSKQLRHTYATMLYFSETDVLVAKEQLGHSKVSTTLDFYCHLDEKFKKRNIKNFNKYLAENDFLI